MEKLRDTDLDVLMALEMIAVMLPPLYQNSLEARNLRAALGRIRDRRDTAAVKAKQ